MTIDKLAVGDAVLVYRKRMRKVDPESLREGVVHDFKGIFVQIKYPGYPPDERHWIIDMFYMESDHPLFKRASGNSVSEYTVYFAEMDDEIDGL